MYTANFESNRTQAGIGALLLLLSIVPYAGWVLGIVGIVLLVKSMKEFSNYYGDQSIYQNSWTGIKHYIVALIAASVAVTAIVLGALSIAPLHITGWPFPASFTISLVVFGAGLVTAFIFYVLAATHLKTTFNTLAQKSGDQSFATAGTLLLVGSILTILVIGLVLIFIAWIFATVGFFGMRNPQFQQYAQTQPYGYTPPQQPAQPIKP